jgi:diguanylate cyclase (GGDEF)-like protein/PAS domain S-box-containing protein
MDVAWQALVANLSIFSVAILIWIQAQTWLEGRPQRLQRLVFAAMMAAGVILTMSAPAQLHDGVLFDLRGAVLATAAVFGGPITAAVATVLAVVFRLLLGGDGTWPGIAGILLASLLGVWAHYRIQWRDPQRGIVVLLSVGVAATNLISTALLAPVVPIAALLEFGLPAAFLNGIAAFGGILAILHDRAVRNERYLLRAAITQAPDFFYVKDRGSRLVAVNHTVAAYQGYAAPADMRGKSDYDLAPEERADTLFAAEQDLMRSKIPQINLEENLVAPDGTERWFVTSKVPLLDQEGGIVGLVGVTRDDTERRRLETELIESRNLFSRALAEMSDGLAMFDDKGDLVFCNERYRTNFPLTADVRRPGANLRDILRRVAETGEQLGITPENADDWIEAVFASLREGGEQEVELYDKRWLHVRTRPANDGSAFVLVSNVTSMKKAETHLRKLTEQLRALASTDGLTGLMNRRAFDTAFGTEWLRSGRSAKPLSVLMIDVDKFKTYNDLYGHQAGDACLRKVSQALEPLMRRAGDIAARYGGEEFVVLLPETDEDGALFIAQSLCDAVRDLAITHAGGNNGVVTISIGVATAPAPPNVAAPDLIARADQALYAAKASGRDRAAVWTGATSMLAQRAAG